MADDQTLSVVAPGYCGHIGRGLSFWIVPPAQALPKVVMEDLAFLDAWTWANEHAASIAEAHRLGRYSVQCWCDGDSYIGCTVMTVGQCNGGQVLDIIAAKCHAGANFARRIEKQLTAQAREHGLIAIRWISPRPWHRLINAKRVESTYIIEV